MNSHPAARLFPPVSNDELQALAADIKAHGLHHPIVTLQAAVLDGRNRLKACQIAGVEPRFVEWDGQGSPMGYVISANLRRRHLTKSQAAAIAAEKLELFARTKHPGWDVWGNEPGL